VDLVAAAAVELEVAGQRDRVARALLERLADVVYLERGEQLDVVEHLAADRREDAAALERAGPAPRAFERGARRGDRRRRCRRRSPRAMRARSLPSDGSRGASVAPPSAGTPLAADQDGFGRNGNDEAEAAIGAFMGLSCGRAGGFAPS
jgi:hypothetical protein